VHRITPENTGVSLSSAVLTMDTAAAGRQRIDRQLDYIPPLEQPIALQSLVDRVIRTSFPSWPSPPVTLCRCDPNPENFLRRSDSLASVDWEYSGWRPGRRDGEPRPKATTRSTCDGRWQRSTRGARSQETGVRIPATPLLTPDSSRLLPTPSIALSGRPYGLRGSPSPRTRGGPAIWLSRSERAQQSRRALRVGESTRP
jgi:hypothetical protein